MGMTANRCGVTLWGDEKILKLDSDDGCIIVNILTVIELCFKWVNFMASELYLNNIYLLKKTALHIK